METLVSVTSATTSDPFIEKECGRRVRVNGKGYESKNEQGCRIRPRREGAGVMAAGVFGGVPAMVSAPNPLVPGAGGAFLVILAPRSRSGRAVQKRGGVEVRGVPGWWWPGRSLWAVVVLVVPRP